MKTTISLPDAIFDEAEALAQQLGISRSELYIEALKAYLRRSNRKQVLSKLNEGQISSGDRLSWVSCLNPTYQLIPSSPNSPRAGNQ